MQPKELWEAYSNRTVRPSMCPSRFVSCSFKNNCVRSMSLILFQLGITNLVCECILGWGSVVYHNWVTVTLNLTSDLVSSNCIEFGAYLLYSFRLEFQIWCLNASLDGGVSYIPFRVTETLTSDLVVRIFVFRAYFLYSLR